MRCCLVILAAEGVSSILLPVNDSVDPVTLCFSYLPPLFYIPSFFFSSSNPPLHTFRPPQVCFVPSKHQKKKPRKHFQTHKKKEKEKTHDKIKEAPIYMFFKKQTGVLFQTLASESKEIHKSVFCFNFSGSKKCSETDRLSEALMHKSFQS